MAEQDKELVQKLNPIFLQFKEAEKAIKSAEVAETEISLTAVNQIRYAFNHLSEAITCHEIDDIVNRDANLGRSLGHCRRAFYDACDAEITFYLDRINKFIQDCHDKGLGISTVIEQYPSKKALILKAQNFLKTQYDIQDKTDRYKQAEVLRNDINQQIFIYLSGYHDVANDQINQAKKLQVDNERALEALKVSSQQASDANLLATKANQLAKRSIWVGTSMAILGILFGIGIVVFDVDLKSLRQIKGTPELQQK